MPSIPHDPVPQPQNTSGGAFQQSTQDHKMYYRANFWIDKEVPCATLRGEDGCIIVACCILHNLTVNLREPEPEDCDMDGGEIGSAVRKHIAYNFFSISTQGYCVLCWNAQTHTCKNCKNVDIYCSMIHEQ